MEVKHSEKCGAAGRVLLLTPYSGGNLGDQAIVTGLIRELGRRLPGVEVIGLTERPNTTANIHGIPCFPISVAAVPVDGGQWLQMPSRNAAPQPLQARSYTPFAETPTSRIRILVRSIPLARPLLRLMRRSLNLLRRIRDEMAFTLRARALLRPGDLLLLAGGGQIDDEWGGAWAHPFTVWRWTALAKSRECQIGVSAVGWGELRSAISRGFFSRSLRRADYLSFRDAQSITFTRQLGVANEALNVPDHALGLDIQRHRERQHSGQGDVVGLSPMAFGRAGTWPTVDAACYANYIDCLASLTAELVRQGIQVRLFTTSGMDQHAVADMLAVMQRRPEVGGGAVQVVETLTLEQLIPELEPCGTVIASRLHGVILAHRLAIPTLAISFDRKVSAHMADAGQSEYCTDIHAVESQTLAAIYARLLKNRESVGLELKQFQSECRQQLEVHYDELAKLLTRAINSA